MGEWAGDDHKGPTFFLNFSYVIKQDILTLKMLSKVFNNILMGLKMLFKVLGWS